MFFPPLEQQKNTAMHFTAYSVVYIGDREIEEKGIELNGRSAPLFMCRTSSFSAELSLYNKYKYTHTHFERMHTVSLYVSVHRYKVYIFCCFEQHNSPLE